MTGCAYICQKAYPYFLCEAGEVQRSALPSSAEG